MKYATLISKLFVTTFGLCMYIGTAYAGSSKHEFGASAPIVYSQIKEGNIARGAFSIFGAGLDYKYYITSDTALSVSYEWNSSGTGILYHGASFFYYYSFFGKRSIHSREPVLNLDVNFPVDIFLFLGVINRNYDYREFDSSRTSSLTAKPRDLSTGVMYGGAGGIGFATDVSTNLRFISRLQYCSGFFPDVSNASVTMYSIYTGVGFSL